ncbi:MAG: hypothetical protein WAK84_13725 [Candidatus Cybelea sp.]
MIASRWTLRRSERYSNRHLALTTALWTAFTATALAQTPLPGYSQFDRAQQARLRADLGTWKCLSVPAPTTSRSFTESEQGNWFVARETGDNPATGYERWSYSLKAYVLITIFDSGASNVAQTMSLDPDNATWTQMWPALDRQGRKRFDNQVSRTGDVLRSLTKFYDSKGNIQTNSTTCTKE